MSSGRFVIPFVLPVATFALAIALGSLLLWLDMCAADGPVPFVDALFTATSSVCITGLSSVDPGTAFNRAGHCVMLALIQLGGLGITTYSTLILYMFSRRISLLDRVAVGQALLHDPAFHLGRFLQRVLVIVFAVELTGAALLFCMEPQRIGMFNAIFIAVSGFCNAGFALWSDNLTQWRGHWGVNLVVMGLIIIGGIGFFVLDELLRLARSFRFRAKTAARYSAEQPMRKPPCLSHNSRIVLGTTAGLIVAGALALLLADLGNPAWAGTPFSERLLASFFQSVTSRTAGFNTVSMGMFSDFALLVIAILMFIGGSPGSCAGGIKTTTFRVLCGYFASHLRGRGQVVVGGMGVERSTVNKVLLLFYISLLTLLAATLALTVTENGAAPHGQGPFPVLDLFFEAVSALGTVGLTVNVTPRLSDAGKLVLCLLMFIGRLGPIWLITTIQQFQSEVPYRYPDGELPVG